VVNLWIDQLCINQQDNEEKGSQVRKVAGIYQVVDTTLAWLGEEEYDSNLGMGLLQRWEEMGKVPIRS
jgi:hypothetical protein